MEGTGLGWSSSVGQGCVQRYRGPSMGGEEQGGPGIGRAQAWGWG